MENNRKTTSPFDETKKCLYYSKEKGLYINWFTEDETVGELVCRPHNKEGEIVNYPKGKKFFEIPEKNFRLRISSFFNVYRYIYGKQDRKVDLKKAYLTAFIEYGDLKLLDFDINKLYIKREEYCNLLSFSVPVNNEEKWNMLFNKIISAYNEAFAGKFPTSAIGYIDEINKMFNQEEIHVRDVLHWKREELLTNKLSIIAHIGTKLQDLIVGLETAGCTDEVVINHTMPLCYKFIEKFLELYNEIEKSFSPQFANTLYAIHKFMHDQNAGKEFLRLFLNNNRKKFT